MGMYTEFVMAAQIKNDPTAVQILNYMVNDAELIKVGWPLDWWKFSDNEPPAFEVNCNAGKHE